MFLLAAKQWHAWIAFPLIAAGIGSVFALGAGYIRKVVRPKYPR
jgi:hypothetical protein